MLVPEVVFAAAPGTLAVALDRALPAALIELCDFVAVPNLVGDAEQIQANARWLRGALERRGFRVSLLATPSGRPVVRADLDLGAPGTLILYSHYDGVATSGQQWHSDPYRAVLRRSWSPERPVWGESAIGDMRDWRPDWRLFGRSVADSKNAIVSVLAALDALRSAGASPASNLRLLLDGEEEEESPGLAAALASSPGALAGDLLVCASGETHQSGMATVSLGVRGMLMMSLEVRTATTELHSGHFGGFGRNAGAELARIVASLKDDDGSIVVAGFEEGALPLSEGERAVVLAAPRSEAEVRSRFGMATQESSAPLAELINRPTLNVRGIDAGGVGAEGRNVVLSRAAAELDVRLVAGMDPDRVLAAVRSHVARLGYEVDGGPVPGRAGTGRGWVSVTRVSGFRAVRAPLAQPAVGKLLGAVRAVVGDDLLVQPTDAGSLDFGVFAAAGLPVVTLPTSNSDCNQHTADENLRLGHFDRGIRLFASLLGSF